MTPHTFDDTSRTAKAGALTLHFNEAGHVFVAEELFRSLGGVRVEAGGEPDSVEVGLSTGEESD